MQNTYVLKTGARILCLPVTGAYYSIREMPEIRFLNRLKEQNTEYESPFKQGKAEKKKYKIRRLIYN